jgi:hypothetical protein
VIVSTTNIANTATLTATPDSAINDINVITDGDYSSVYTDALSGEVAILFEFSPRRDIGYIAIGGSNISEKDRLLITREQGDEDEDIFLYTSENDQLIESGGLEFVVLPSPAIDDAVLGLSESNTIMYKVDLLDVQFVNIKVEGTGQIAISEIAMGDYYEIPRGEQSGYNRPWTVPNIATRSSVGFNNSPVNLSYESRALSCTLTVPNNLMVDFTDWYKFINFAASNTFYILEDNDKFHSYACFNAVPSMTTANGQTRSLGSSSIKFNAFSKSTRALF